jgi:CIC family chloride channel protein
LGIFVGMISAVYIKSIYAFEDFFKRRINGSYYRRHMLGMLIVGIMMYFMMKTFGHYYIEGVGYATVQSVLSSNLTILYLLLLLFVLKLLAVSLTLGSGASGGIFSPGLFMGATFGGAYGIAMHTIFPGIGINAPAFAVAAMAGMIGGSTGAALTSVVMIFEMTLDYNVIIPMTLTVAIAYGVRTLFEKDTIYTKKLTRRGHLAPTGLRVNFQHMIRAKELMIRNVGFVDASTELGEFTKMTEANIHYPFYLIKDSANNVVSFIRDDMFDSIEEADSNKTIRDVGISHFIVVSENHLLSDIIAELRSNRASVALVSTAKNRTSASDILGVITEQRILEAIDNVNEMFSGSLR